MKVRYLFVLAVLIISITCYGQADTSRLSASILNSTFNIQPVQHKHRSALNIKNKKIISKLNPLLYVGVGLMYFYQNIISEQLQADCTYMMSCSEFTKKSIEKKGFAKGTLLGFNQLYNCFPGAVYERSEYLINSDSKVNNILDEEN